MYKIIPTKAFRKQTKKHKSNHELKQELNKKIQQLKEEPEKVGGKLSGKLHGMRSTRLTAKFRLIFSIEGSSVYLIALDHRRRVYD